MSCASRNIHLISCLLVIFGLTFARPPQKPGSVTTPTRQCILGKRLFNAALANSTKKFGDSIVVEEAMGVTIDNTDWSELNMTRQDAKDCLKEYFNDEASDDITETQKMIELPASDEADDDEKVTTYLKPYNFRQKGYFVKAPKVKESDWSKVTRYYDKFVDKVADFIGISD